MNYPANTSIISGLMRLNNLNEQDAYSFLDFLIANNVKWFDHADIYGGGNCEAIFGNWLANRHIPRDQLVIQSKCGIVPGICYNNSGDYIIKSVDQILSRLRCDYLDYLLIHRPDILWEADDINSAFNQLHDAGKVKAFGVSNCNSSQIAYLNDNLTHKIAINQIQLSLAFAPCISENLETNTYSQNGIDRTMGVIDYCRRQKIIIQAWSPLQYGTFAGTFLNNPSYGVLNGKLDELGAKYLADKSAIAAAWIKRIPPCTQVICGSCNQDHVGKMLRARDINLTREEWYSLYQAAGYSLP